MVGRGEERMDPVRKVAELESDLGAGLLLRSARGLTPTDAGAAYDPLASEGLAGRIALNDAVNPVAGGAAWRLRDGLGSAAPGDAGDPALLDALRSRLGEVRAPAGAALGRMRDDCAVWVREAWGIR